MSRFLCALALFTLPAAAQAYSAIDLLRDCRTAIAFSEGRGQLKDAIHAGKCMGYLDGIIDGNAIATGLKGPQAAMFCAPREGIQIEQAVLIIVKYLTDNPDKLNETARIHTFIALRKAFPCR